MSSKKIIIICAILISLAALEAAAYFIWERAYKDPSAVKLREQQERDAAYSRLLSDSLRQVDDYDYIVVIDPAQGGSEKGNTAGEICEKDITLALGKKIKEKNTNREIGIFLTRETDTNPTQEQRNTFIEQMKPDLLIGINVNKSMQSSNLGTTAFYRDDYYNNKLSNVDFADMLERGIVTAVEGNAGGVFVDDEKQYSILDGRKIPSASIECGYISNPVEGILLARGNYQNNMVKGFLEAINQAVERLDGQQGETAK